MYSSLNHHLLSLHSSVQLDSMQHIMIYSVTKPYGLEFHLEYHIIVSIYPLMYRTTYYHRKDSI